MSNDADWVADVRRWVENGSASATVADMTVQSADEGDALGYEAAHPVLQARHWPDAAHYASIDAR